MKKILFFLLAVTFGFVAQAQNKDYGTIKQGADGLRVFEFKNTGKAPLVISGASSSCGCTVPSYPKDPIAPGGTGKIEVRYDTNRVGAIAKTIMVTSNATDTPNVALRIKGKVE